MDSVSHPCNYKGDGSIGSFASIHRADRLCTVRPARSPMSEVIRVSGLLGGKPVSLAYSCGRGEMSLQPPPAAFPDLEHAFGAKASTHRLPGASELPLCRHAVLTARRGECPGVTRGPDAPRCEAHKVLRFSRSGHCPPRQARTNRDFPHGNSLEAKKDAMIRRLCLVAGPAGSEWLTRTFIDWSINIY